MNLNVPFVMTKSGINVYIDGKMESVANDHPNYDQIYDGLTMGLVSVKEISDLVNVAKSIENFSGNHVRIENDTFFWDGVEMANALTLRIMDLLKKGKSIGALTNFMSNLMMNPSFRAVNELYGFLDACTLPITLDGCFLAYKKVNKEYKSIHASPDGTFLDNSIGSVVKMGRNLVDENPDQTCSTGLHCCSFEYLRHYGDATFDKVIIVKVNPRDVVAVPKDYNNQKMRVCEYSVVGELPNDQVTELRDKYTTEEYTSDDEDYDDEENFDDDDYGDDYDTGSDDGDGGDEDVSPMSFVPYTAPAKKTPIVGDWECRDCQDVDCTKFYGNMTQNQAKAAFARWAQIPYTDVRVRRA